MNPAAHEVCLLLGSNIRPEHYIPQAVELLQRHLQVLQASSVWETSAVGSDGPNFLNAALLVLSPFGLDALKERILHPIEARLGRVRTGDKNAARTMDIDVIIFDGLLLETTLSNYAFRAVPVAEILPDTRTETGEYLKDAAERLTRTDHIRLRTDVTLVEIIKWD
jgi:2-amino-4-hydroxy-6-hydroxymethyldihydropteridine diphosphokinase